MQCPNMYSLELQDRLREDGGQIGAMEAMIASAFMNTFLTFPVFGVRSIRRTSSGLPIQPSGISSVPDYEFLHDFARMK